MRNWLKNIREGAELSQDQVAKTADISQQHYSFIENGERRPSPEVAQKLASVLGFDWTRFYNPDAGGDKSA